MYELQRTDAEINSIFAAAKRMARRYGRIGIQEPDDICQDALLKVLRKNNGRSPHASWLYTVVHNTAMDAGRKAVKEERVIWRDRDEADLSSVCERADQDGYFHNSITRSAGSVEDVEIDLLPQLKNMLSKLRKPLRQVLVLYSEGHSYAAIAAMTGTNIGTVRSRLHYARKRAKDLLGDIA